MPRMAVVAIAAALALGACGGEPRVKPGDPAVYERIEAMESCGRLKQQVEDAIAASLQVRAADAKEAQLAYALAGRARMKELDC